MTIYAGALNLTREAAENSRRTQAKGRETQDEITKAEQQCKRTEALVGRKSSEFFQGQQDNTIAVEKLDQNMSELEHSIPDLNNQVNKWYQQLVPYSLTDTASTPM